MITSLLTILDSDLRGFKDQILASETLPTTANAYSQLLHSIIGIKLRCHFLRVFCLSLK